MAIKPWNKKSILSRETVYIADVNHRWPQIHPPTSRWRCVCFCLCVNTRWTQATSKAAWDAGCEICLRAFHFCPSIMRIRNFLRCSSRNSIIIFRAFLTKGPYRHPSCSKVWALLLSPECPHSECLCNYAGDACTDANRDITGWISLASDLCGPTDTNLQGGLSQVGHWS